MQTAPTDLQRANMRRLYLDVLWMGLAIVMEWYYLNVFAVRLGATPAHLGAMTSIRALLLALGAGLIGPWNRLVPNKVVNFAIPIFLYRVFMYLLPALVPFLPSGQVDAYVLLIALSALPHGLAAALFLGLIRGAVGEQHLARFMSRRGLMLNVSVLVWVAAIGPLLENSPFPGNYQIAFFGAFIGSLGAIYYVALILQRKNQPPQEPAALPDETPTKPPARFGLRVWREPRFVRFSLITLAVHFSVFMGIPIAPILLVRGLGAGDSWIALFSVAELIAGGVAMAVTHRLIARFGTTFMIAVSTLATISTALALALVPSLPFFALMQIIFGAGWFAIGVVLYVRLAEIAPPDAFPQYAANYQILLSVALFVGPLFGTFLIENVMSLTVAMLVSAVLRGVAALLTLFIDRRAVPVAGTPLPTDTMTEKIVAP